MLVGPAPGGGLLAQLLHAALRIGVLCGGLQTMLPLPQHRLEEDLTSYLSLGCYFLSCPPVLPRELSRRPGPTHWEGWGQVLHCLTTNPQLWTQDLHRPLELLAWLWNFC